MATCKIRTGLAALAVTALMLTGCSADATAGPAPTPTATQEAAITAADIATIEDGIEWARSLDDSAEAEELSAGVTKIGSLVPDLDIWFAENNKIGMALIKLNAAALEDPANAGAKVDDLNVIIDDLEAAITKGTHPRQSEVCGAPGGCVRRQGL